MKTRQRSQHLHWCVSVNSDTGVFVYASVCESCYCIPVLKRGSCVGHPNWGKVKENVCGRYLPGEEDGQGQERHFIHTSINKHIHKSKSLNLPNVAL